MSSSDETVHYRACNLCEAICGLEIKMRDGQVTAIRGDDEDPFSRGHICPKAVALMDLQSDPDRLRRPVRRSAQGWEQISWEQAFDLAAQGIRRLQSEYGRGAMAVYVGNPTVHNYGSLLYGPPMLRALGTRNRYSATSVDQLPHHFAANLMFGHQLLLPIPDIDRTQFFLVLGANPAVSNGSLMTAPGVKRRLKELRQRGGKLVVVDPRRTETARLADEHFFVRPGSDVFLLAAMVHTLLDEDLAKPGSLRRHLKGLDELDDLFEEYAPERVAQAVGIEASRIRELARSFASAPAAVCYGRMGLSVTEMGGLCQWLVNLVNILTGNLDRAGGAMFTRPAVDLLRRTSRGRHGRWRSRVRGLPEFGGELPVATLAEDMLTPGEGQIRGLLTSAGNPVLSTPDGQQLDRALAGLDFMVSVDFYINETTRHAHVILPPTAPLEHDHYDLVFHLLAVRNTSRYSPALVRPSPDSRHDWQIFLELEQRLAGRRGSLPQRLRALAGRALRRRMGPRGLLDLGLRSGPWGSGILPFHSGLNLGQLRRAPHGVDLGPLQPCLPQRLFTADRKVDLCPTPLVEDLDRMEEALQQQLQGDRGEPGEDRLLLIGRRQVRSNNSWMHNVPRLMRGKDRCTLLVHPQDAARLGLDDGQHATVRSAVGEVSAPAQVSDEIMPGVVSLPHGWGHRRQGVEQRLAREQPGPSINDLTDSARVDTLTGNAALNGVPVQVIAEPASNDPPGDEGSTRSGA